MEALASVPVTTLCDVDKSLPVVDPAIRPLTSTRVFGPAYTVVAAGEFLSVLYAIGEAAPGDVLVVQAGGAPLAALGELLATEAWQRKLGGIVVDGYVRDRTGLPPDLPVWARGTVPMAGRSDVVPRVGGPVVFGGVRVSPGDARGRRRRRHRDRAARATRGDARARRRRSSAWRRSVLGEARQSGADLLADEPARARRALRAGEPSSLSITPPS